MPVIMPDDKWPEKEIREAISPSPALDTLKIAQLREIAKEEIIDIKGLRKKADIIEAIKTARA